MKILVVASYNKNRYAPFILEQAEALKHVGCEVDYFGVVGKGIKGYFNAFGELRNKIKSFKPDIIHAHYGLSGLLANLQRSVPVVTTYHGSDINLPNVLRLSKIAMKLSAWNIFVSQRNVDIAKPKKNYVLLPCGVNLPNYVEEDMRKRIWKELSSQLIQIFQKPSLMSGLKIRKQDVEQMRRFGEAIGMAFQIQDDILDYSRSAQTGKPKNNDLREGKITLPLIEVLEKCSPAEKLQLLDKLSQCKDDDSAVDFLQGVVEATGGLAMAARTMQTYIDRATAILANYADSPYRTALVNLCAYIAERDK